MSHVWKHPPTGAHPWTSHVGRQRVRNTGLRYINICAYCACMYVHMYICTYVCACACTLVWKALLRIEMADVYIQRSVCLYTCVKADSTGKRKGRTCMWACEGAWCHWQDCCAAHGWRYVLISTLLLVQWVNECEDSYSYSYHIAQCWVVHTCCIVCKQLSRFSVYVCGLGCYHFIWQANQWLIFKHHCKSGT